ncbi:MAG: hypothetical protein KDD69_05260 [Bdellovibrionales bacterium]|nr:hypothetical protein [Bdellovibrionales bacterium]
MSEGSPAYPVPPYMRTNARRSRRTACVAIGIWLLLFLAGTAYLHREVDVLATPLTSLLVEGRHHWAIRSAATSDCLGVITTEFTIPGQQPFGSYNPAAVLRGPDFSATGSIAVRHEQQTQHADIRLRAEFNSFFKLLSAEGELLVSSIDSLLRLKNVNDAPELSVAHRSSTSTHSLDRWPEIYLVRSNGATAFAPRLTKSARAWLRNPAFRTEAIHVEEISEQDLQSCRAQLQTTDHDSVLLDTEYFQKGGNAEAHQSSRLGRSGAAVERIASMKKLLHPEQVA